MRVTIFGSGYVGLVTGACLADAGNDVLCVDGGANKIEGLKRGEIPIHEPGLVALFKPNADAVRLGFTTSAAAGVVAQAVAAVASAAFLAVAEVSVAVEAAEAGRTLAINN